MGNLFDKHPNVPTISRTEGIVTSGLEIGLLLTERRDPASACAPRAVYARLPTMHAAMQHATCNMRHCTLRTGLR